MSVVLGWGTAYASVTLGALFQGLFLPRIFGPPSSGMNGGNAAGPLIFYFAIFGISILGGLVTEDTTMALASFFMSYLLGAALVYFVLALPGFVGAFPLAEALVETAIVFTFTALFPFPLIIGLFGTILGVALAERLQ